MRRRRVTNEQRHSNRNTRIRQAAKDLRKANEDILIAAQKKAETERDSRMKLAREIMTLREKGLQVSIINDVAKGNCADAKYQRDLAEVVYRSTLEAIESQRSQLSALQSALKYME